MSKKQKDTDLEDDDVKFKIHISRNRRFAKLEIYSGQEMTEKDVIELIEYFIYDNILEGYQPGRDLIH